MIADSELRQQRPLPKRALKRLVLPLFFRKFSGFLTVGDANEQCYSSYGVPSEKLFRSPFPIDVATFRSHAADGRAGNQEIRNELGIPAKNLIVSVVGKLIPRKGQADLLSALKFIDPARAPVSLLLIGAGPDESRLREEAKTIRGHQVVSAGFTQPAELPRLLAATDVYAHPSSVDPHPLAISEAILCGCPVIVSNRCGSHGPTDDVRHGSNGFVFDFGNQGQLAAAISTLATDRELRQRFGGKSRDIAVQSQQIAHGEGLINALTGCRQSRACPWLRARSFL